MSDSATGVLHVETWGASERHGEAPTAPPPIAMIHGCGAPRSCMVHLANALARTHRVVIPALPGYAPSPATPSPYSFADVDRLVLATLRAHGLRSCTLVGFSMGAWRALAIAAAGGLDVRRLVLLGGFADLSAEERAQYRVFARALRSGEVPRGLWARRMLSAGYARAHPEDVDVVDRSFFAIDPATIVPELEAIADEPDVLAQVEQIEAPIVARVGAEDVAAPPHKSAGIVRAARRATLQIVPGAGHHLPLEDIQGCVSAIAGES